ncbi:MAG: hypothetical protein QOK07_2074 [Gemmatimonadaceae bacterium]|nr:hypothetical protein [Gemmatimonadaceae bacterium]
MKRLLATFSLCLAALPACTTLPRVASTESTRTYEIRNGKWFTGSGFVDRTWYTRDGVFASSRPSRIDSVIDLHGQYVVPPFAEAHNHWLEPKAIDAYLQAYLRDGVFYLKDMSNAPVIRVLLDSALNKPTSVDFISPNQGFTGPGGHPLQIARQFLAFGSFPPNWTDGDLAGNVVNIVDSPADIDRAWPGFISGHPAFVKVFLLYSEQYERRKNDSAFLYKRGLNPALLAQIVGLAHARGLRVSAHVYTAADFHNALIAGVDDIGHMPGAGYDSVLGYRAFRIAPADAELAGRRHVSMTTTIIWLDDYEGVPRQRLIDSVVRPNLELLRANRVPILLGSDEFRGTPLHEAKILASLGVFSNLELLNIWSHDTPQAIFPRRKIGSLADGYEASFLVLGTDPTADFGGVERITMRMKQGHVLPAPRAVPFPALGQ